MKSVANDNGGKSPDYKQGDTYLVCQLEKRVKKIVYLVELADGRYLNMTEDELKEAKQNKLKYTILRRGFEDRIETKIVCPYFEGITLKKAKYNMPVKNFSVFKTYSFDFNMSFAEQTSLFFVLIDIQNRINKGMSQQVDLVTQILSGGWHIDKKEKDVIKTMKQKGNQPNQIYEYINMKANKAQRTEVQDVPQGALQTVQTDVGFIDDISNVTPAMQGFSEKSSETGILYEKKLQQGSVSTNPYYDIIANMREILAKDYVQLVPYIHFENDKFIDILEKPTGSLKREMVNITMKGETFRDVRTVAMRVVLDDGENTPNRLERSFQENVALANVMINAGATFADINWGLIIEHSPMQDKELWADFIQQRQQIQENVKANTEANDELKTLVDTAGRIPAA